MEQIQISEQRKSHTLFYCLFAIMLGMVAVRNVFHISFPIVLFLGVVAIIAMFCNKDDIIATAIACIPLSTAFQYKYALFICIIAYCIRFSKNVKITYKVVPVLLMLFWEMLHFGMGQFALLEVFRGFAELMFLCFLFSVEEEEFDLKFIAKIFAFTATIICIFIFLVQLEQNHYDISKIFSGKFRFGAADEEIENFGLNFNENGLGGICNLAIIGMLLVSDKGRVNVIDIIIIGLLSIFGTMTMSRTFLICFVILILYYFAFQNGSLDKKMMRFLGIIGIFLLSFFLLKSILPEVIENFTDRFKESDITNGRNFLFSFYHEHIISSPVYTFFGIGLQDFKGKIEAIYSVYHNVCHNGYQEIVVVWGIPGFVLLISLLGCVLAKPSESSSKRKLLQYGPMVVLLITIFAGQFIRSGTAILELSFAYLCLNYDKESTAKIKKE